MYNIITMSLFSYKIAGAIAITLRIVVLVLSVAIFFYINLLLKRKLDPRYKKDNAKVIELQDTILLNISKCLVITCVLIVILSWLNIL